MKDKKTYIFVVNPIAGGIDKADITKQVQDFGANLDIDIVIYETTGTSDDHKIQKLFLEFEPERILVAGGDGTLKMVSEALEDKEYIMGIVPAGSANGLSVDLEFPTDLNEILKIAFINSPMEIDMISINQQKSLHLSDIGLNAELIKNYENSTIRGKLGYALQSFNTLRDQELPFTVTIYVNDLKVETDAKMVVIANSRRYGTGVTINPFGKMDDGKFEIIILKNLDLFLFGKIVMGNMPLGSDDLQIISTSKARISTDIPVHFQVDGEYFGTVNELDVHIIPKSIKIAVPAT